MGSAGTFFAPANAGSYLRREKPAKLTELSPEEGLDEDASS
jgi:hypothetical protein